MQGGFRNPIVHTTSLIGEITSDQIADGAVIEAKLADLAVAANKLRDEAVNNSKLADDSVSEIKIQDLAVTQAKIGLLAVGSAQIDDLAVTDAKINTLSASKITAGTISAGTITLANRLNIGTNGTIRTGPGGKGLYVSSSLTNYIQWIGSGGDEITDVEANINWDGAFANTFHMFGSNAVRIEASGIGSNVYLRSGGIDRLTTTDAGITIGGNITSDSFKSFGDRNDLISTGVSLNSHIPYSTGDVYLSAGSGRFIRMRAVSNGTIWQMERTGGEHILRANAGDWYEIDETNDFHQFYIGGNEKARFASSSIEFPGRATTTDSGLAAWRNDGFPGKKLLALSSSQEDKTAIKDANPKPWLKRLDELQPRQYRSKTNHDDGRRVLIGLIKEEAEKVWPNWTYEAMTTPFLMAIQDLRKRVAELEKAA